MADKARKNVHFSQHSLRFLKDANDSLSGRVNTVIDRYHEALRRSTAVTAAFTDKELASILEACHDIDLDPAAHIFASMNIAIAEHGASDALMNKLDHLDPWEQVLLAEWIEGQRQAA